MCSVFYKTVKLLFEMPFIRVLFPKTAYKEAILRFYELVVSRVMCKKVLVTGRNLF